MLILAIKFMQLISENYFLLLMNTTQHVLLHTHTLYSCETIETR